jgi:CRISPR/Cas system CMR subunit Cmr6 (Cas7 group RAMP superfamily)
MTDSKRTYFKVTYTLESSLAVGASSSTKTEHDAVLDGDGNPIIPATAIAGAYRHLADPEQAKELFGFVVIRKAGDADRPTDTPSHKQSRLLFYDAELQDPEKLAYHKSTRDAVKLDSYKTSEPKHKYDFEIIEPGAVFTTYIEACDSGAAAAIYKLLQHVVSFGAKTTRGYGRVSAKWCARQFNLDKQQD